MLVDTSSELSPVKVDGVRAFSTGYLDRCLMPGVETSSSSAIMKNLYEYVLTLVGFHCDPPSDCLRECVEKRTLCYMYQFSG